MILKAGLAGVLCFGINGVLCRGTLAYFRRNIYPELARNNVLIDVVFIPSFFYKSEKEDKTLKLHLKTDCTAEFVMRTLEDSNNFPELYKFKGGWKEAYILLIKTLQKGWPQQKFPEEFEQFL